MRWPHKLNYSRKDSSEERQGLFKHEANLAAVDRQDPHPSSVSQDFLRKSLLTSKSDHKTEATFLDSAELRNVPIFHTIEAPCDL